MKEKYKMKKVSILALFIAIFSFSLSAETLVSISGSTLTGFSGIKQEDNNPFRGQFESAANLGINLQQGEELFIDFELAMAGAGSVSQFATAFLFFTLNYKPENLKGTEFTAGLMTLPFGQFSENQTDNAGIYSPFIYNDLGYTLLKKNSPVYQFASNGFKVTQALPHGSIEGSVFNGTDGFDNNPDKGFGVAVRYLNDTFIPNTTLGTSFFNSNDSGNDNAINANSTGYIADFKTVIDDVQFGAYISMLNLNDHNDATEDDVTSYMVYVAKNYGTHSIALRYSIVKPEDYDGSDSGMSSALPALGLSNITVEDIDVQRIQLAGILHVSDTFNLHNELIYDSYGDNQTDYNTMAVLSYATLKF